MFAMFPTAFSPSLQLKIDTLIKRSPSVRMGRLNFTSPLVLAPMASITHFPMRQLMQDLGSGASVSELISCHGLNYGNEKTLKMLRIGPRERTVGIQLFGENSEDIKRAAWIAQNSGPHFIDINMGCPVRKVVTKGGGAALLKEPDKLYHFFKIIKDELSLPLTIKIRTGWDDQHINAEEIAQIAFNSGIEFVAVHGRTRVQQYKGKADWNYLEHLAKRTRLPIIGNGDIHSSIQANLKLKETHCKALMLGRGPLKNPFIFLESFRDKNENLVFIPSDYWEISRRYLYYLESFFDRERSIFLQFRKIMMWFVSGFSHTSQYRSEAYRSKTLKEVFDLTEKFFMESGDFYKKDELDSSFLTSGHG